MCACSKSAKYNAPKARTKKVTRTLPRCCTRITVPLGCTHTHGSTPWHVKTRGSVGRTTHSDGCPKITKSASHTARHTAKEREREHHARLPSFPCSVFPSRGRSVCLSGGPCSKRKCISLRECFFFSFFFFALLDGGKWKSQSANRGSATVTPG